MQERPYQHSVKKALLLTVLSMYFCMSAAFSQPYKSSLGVLTNLGSRKYFGAGPVFKIFFTPKSAGEAGFLFTKGGYHISLLYQYHFPLNSTKNFNGYIGAGVYNIIFPRAVAGLEYKFNNAPISITADWRPYYIYFSDDDIDPTEGLRYFGVGLRYILKK